MTIKPADLVEALKARWLVVAAITGVLFALIAGIALMQPRPVSRQRRRYFSTCPRPIPPTAPSSSRREWRRIRSSRPRWTSSRAPRLSTRVAQGRLASSTRRRPIFRPERGCSRLRRGCARASTVDDRAAEQCAPDPVPRCRSRGRRARRQPHRADLHARAGTACGPSAAQGSAE